MILRLPFRPFAPSLAVLLVGLALAPAPAPAQVVKPFKITGQGVGPLGLPLPGQDPRLHWIVGEATHLGRHSGEGTVRTDSAVFGENSSKGNLCTLVQNQG